MIWAPPWRVDRPANVRPPPGPDREAWLDHRLLFRTSHALKAVLDQIHPAIALNERITTLDEEAVTVALLEFLENTTAAGSDDSKKHRISPRKARVFLDYFVRGFRRYCQNHGLRQPRLPLIREFSLDEGALFSDAFDSLRDHRRYTQRLTEKIDQLLINAKSQTVTPEMVAALVVCSGALFGGLVRTDHWEALATALNKPLVRTGTLFCFLFDQPEPYRWIADPITEALLRRLGDRGLLPLPEATKTTAKSIGLMLGMDGRGETALPRLARAVRAAHVRHFAPDVASVAQGLIPNTPLADEPWLRLISGTRHPATRAKIELSIPRVMPKAQTDTVQQVAIEGMIDEVAVALRWDPKARRRQENNELDNQQGVRKFTSDAKIAIRACEGKLAQFYARAGHPNGHTRTFAYGLLCYARDLLELGGLKIRELAPSTISGYVGIVRTHLAQLHFSDLVELGTEARAEAYRKSIRQQLAQDRRIHRTALEGFERSILRHMDLTDEVDWASIPGRAKRRHLPAADANLIDPKLYRHVFEALEVPARHNLIIELARALWVILYRFGLRTGEAAEVTVGALVLSDTERHASLRIARSDLTSRKSKNALRRVGPIELPADEITFLRDYREQRISGAAKRGRDRAESFLFAMGNSDKLTYVELAQEFLIGMVRQMAGDPNLRPRHLRHSFVSRLFLSGRDCLDCLETVAASAAGNEWWRTYATGHASPETGIVSYIHVNELAHYHYARQLIADEVLLAFLSRLAGNDARSLERTQLRAAAERPVVELFLQSLRKNFPCSDIPNALDHRIGYPSIALQREPEFVEARPHRPSWEQAWAIYADARVGRTSNDLDEHAASIRDRVHELEARERLVRRVKRRPQLDAEESAAAATIWKALPSDSSLCALINEAVEWLRPRGRQILMPSDIARELQQLLLTSGLKRIQSRQGESQRRWLWCPDANGEFSTAWLELVAFIYCAGERLSADL